MGYGRPGQNNGRNAAAVSDTVCQKAVLIKGGGFIMTEYYKAEDLEKFGDVGKYNPALFKKFMDWYTASLEPGTLTKREKVLIGVAIAHAIQCPYCIDAYTKSCMEEGLSLEHITEAVHVASAIRGGASLIHTLQAQNAIDRNSL